MFSLDIAVPFKYGRDCSFYVCDPLLIKKAFKVNTPQNFLHIHIAGCWFGRGVQQRIRDLTLKKTNPNAFTSGSQQPW